MHKLLVPLVIFLCLTSEAQNDIDTQVWKPFVESYQNFDFATFNSLHSDDVLRISGNEIRNAKTYKSKNEAWFKRAKLEGYKQSIRLRFEKRIVTGDKAFEMGYYEVKITRPDKSKSTHYARFHVMLRKENGIWKITQDWDSGSLNGVEVTAEDFNKLATYTKPIRSEYIHFTQQSKDSLDNKDIRSLYEDRHKTLWIGTKAQGIYRFKDGTYQN